MSTLAQAFWEKVDRTAGPDGCWPYKGTIERKDGYGVFHYDRGRWRAHRVALELSLGVPLGDDLSLHHCDNPPCCNPAHLYAGTTQENTADRQRRNPTRTGAQSWSATHPERLARGERNGKCVHPDRYPVGERVNTAKLAAPQVVEIRRRLAAGERQYPLAREYGITRSSMFSIAHGRSWKHLLAAIVALVLCRGAAADVRCSSTPCLDSSGGAGFTSPVTTDPVVFNGASTFDKVISATLGIAAPSPAGASSIELGTSAGTLTFGGTADAFELKVVATDPTLDKTVTIPEYGTPATGGEFVIGDFGNASVNFYRWPAISNINYLYGPAGGAGWLIGWASAQTIPSAVLRVETGTDIFLVTEFGDQAFNFAVPAQTDPTIVVASHNQSVDERVGIQRNAVQGKIVDLANSAGATRPVGLVGGSIVASAATITPTGNVFHVSGTTNIDTLTIMDAGTRATLIFDGILTVGDLSGNINLSAALITTANDTLTLVSDGTTWFEAGRSVN